MEISLIGKSGEAEKALYGKSMFNMVEAERNDDSRWDVINVDVKEYKGGVSLKAASSGGVPMGRSATCPIADLQKMGIELKPRHPFPRVGIVIIPTCEGKILLTRRESHMRTFPRAWVLPGGAIDAGETLQQAGIRELKEETNLDTSGPLHLMGLWESGFPTLVSGCIQRQELSSHFLVVFYKSEISNPSDLKLSPNEGDAAVWTSPSEIISINSSDDVSSFPPINALVTTDDDLLTKSEIKADLLKGVYPNSIGEGIGQGHLFIINQLINLNEK